MKKSFVLLILLVVLAVSVVCFGQTSILAEKDQVNITETILYGDKSVVEGVILQLQNHYENQIFWDTTYVIGEEPKIDTEYTFYQEKNEEYVHQWMGAISFYDDIVRDMNWHETAIVEQLEGIEVAMQELYEDTDAGEYGEKLVLLKDYYDYYPFSVDFQGEYDSQSGTPHFFIDLNLAELESDIHFGNATENDTTTPEKWLEWLMTFQDYFKVPILDTEASIISIEKDEEGNLIGFGMSTCGSGMGSGEIDIPDALDYEKYDHFQFETRYTVADGDAYFTFYSHSYNDVVVDTSLIPGGYGIYHFPYDEEKEEIYPEKLQMVYALDPNLDVQDLTRDARGENLLLFTMEEAEMYMSVIDIETMTLVDKFNLSETREDAWGLDYYVLEEDYMVILTYGDIIVFTIDEDGNYTKAFEVSREHLKEIPLEGNEYNYEVLQYDTVFDWNGEELLFANNMYNVNGYMGTNFYVGVIDENGLQYFAIYDTSLRSTLSKDEQEYYNYNYKHCRPLDKDPILINWNE